jgi:hypothetical protein
MGKSPIPDDRALNSQGTIPSIVGRTDLALEVRVGDLDRRSLARSRPCCRPDQLRQKEDRDWAPHYMPVAQSASIEQSRQNTKAHPARRMTPIIGDDMAEQLDDRSAADNLKAYVGVTRESRELCKGAILAAIESDEAITQRVAARLQEYRDPQYQHTEELVTRAKAVEQAATSWMPPLLAAQGLVVAVSVGQIASEGNSAIEALEEHQRHVTKALPDILTLLSISQRLAKADKPEERVELLLTLSDDELRTGARLRDVLDNERERLDLLVERAIFIQAEIADTLASILDYLVARRLFVDGFIKATEYFDDVAPEERMAFAATMAGAAEAAEIAIEFLVTKAGPKLLEQVPIVGIAVGAASLVNEMRVKRREFRERSAQIRERAKTLIGRNATDEVIDLEKDLAGDAEKLVELREMVGMLEEFLRQSASDSESGGS